MTILEVSLLPSRRVELAFREGITVLILSNSSLILSIRACFFSAVSMRPSPFYGKQLAKVNNDIKLSDLIVTFLEWSILPLATSTSNEPVRSGVPSPVWNRNWEIKESQAINWAIIKFTMSSWSGNWLSSSSFNSKYFGPKSSTSL